MKMTKRLAALALAALMLLTMTACGDTSWAAQYGDTKIPTGIYTLSVLSEYASNYNSGVVPVYGLDGEITLTEDGQEVTKRVSDYISEHAMETFKCYVAVKDLFDSKGLTVKQSDYDAMLEQLSGYYQANADTYEKNGVSENSFNDMFISHSIRTNDLFDSIYSGTDTVSDSEIKAYFNENYIRFNYMLFNAYDVTKFSPMDKSDDAYTSEYAKLKAVADKQLSEEDFLKEAKKYPDQLIREGGTWDPMDTTAASANQLYYDLYNFASGIEMGKSDIKEIDMEDTENGVTYHLIVVAQRIEPDTTGKDYLEKAEDITTSINQKKFYDMLLAHYDEMGVIENKNALRTFSVKRLKLDGFTSLEG